MPSFCITGINSKHLGWTEDLLTSSGVKAAVASAQNDRITFNLWHEKVLAHAHATKTTSPGRLWDQLASDLFIANIESESWVWSDHRSALYLNYWLEFDPSIHFILVYCTPQYFLKTAILTNEKKLSFQELMTEWEQYYQSILDFYLKNSSRCLLIDIEDVMQFPTQFIEACNHKFSLNLQAKTLESSTTSEIKSSIEFLINMLLFKQKEINDFQIKFERNLQDFGRKRHEQQLPWFSKIKAPFFKPSTLQLSTKLNADNVIDDLRSLYFQPQQEARLAIERSVSLSADYENQIHLHQEELKQLKVQKTAVDSEKGQLATQTKNLQEELKQLKAQNLDVSQENELLLTQLHQTQEELEKYFFEHKHAEQLLNQIKARWDRLLQREPGYFDFESMRVSPTADDFQTTLWTFSNLCIGTVELSRLELELAPADSNHKSLEFILRGKKEQGSEERVNWYPSSASNQEEFILSSSNITQAGTLSSSDFETLSLIPPFLLAILDAPEYFNLPTQLSRDALVKTLHQINDLLVKAKNELRIDGLTLKNEQTNHDYEHLWIEIDNFSYQGQKAQHFDFRLSCAHVRPNSFGTHPKLEIPAQANSALLHSWFEESVDDFGPKLELRFALPESMDIQVFHKLSPIDQSFVKALLLKLPSILDQLEHRRTHFHRNLDDWRALALSMVKIFEHVNTPSLGAPKGDEQILTPVLKKNMGTNKVGMHQEKSKKIVTKKTPRAAKGSNKFTAARTPSQMNEKDPG